MIKRTESNTPSKKRRDQKRGASKRRRMMMESLEQRQLLAAQIIELPSVTLPVLEQSREIGTVQAFAFSETEGTADFGENDTIPTADFVPLGTIGGKQDTIDLTGSLPFTTNRPPIILPDGTIINQTFSSDLDYFAFDLRAGDILDIATLGAAGSMTVYNPDGSFWFGVDDNQAISGDSPTATNLVVSYPTVSPLQVVGNSVFAQVVPENGRYTLAIAPNNVQTTYTVGLRVYRPSVESLPIGAQQYIYLDFDGGIFPGTIFTDGSGIPQVGNFRYPSLLESLPNLGLEARDFDELVERIIGNVEEQFDYFGRVGNAGDYDTTGIGGDFGVTILNSRDHIVARNHPLLTRVMVAGQEPDIGLQAGTAVGISTTIDIGNFDMSDTVFLFAETALLDTNTIPLSNAISPLQATGDFIGKVAAHEIGHAVGLRHTTNADAIESVADEGGTFGILGLGRDGIYGTSDDEDVFYADGPYSFNEGILGFSTITNALANTLVTGTVGSSITGRVFNDFNRNGVDNNENGIAGVTVFVDSNGNGVLDLTEPTAVSDANGNIRLSRAPGGASIVVIGPDDFGATTPTTLDVTFGTTTAIAFGFAQGGPDAQFDISGTKFADLNGNGTFDTNETGIGGVYIYLDLDGDDRPDLGEPADITDASGSFSIDFPGPGTYTVREVIEPGFRQTFPATGEHTVVFDGTALTNLDGTPRSGVFNFGNQPSRDFGDAPDNGVQFNYRTLLANDGASHGIVTGLSLGVAVDREANGQQSVNALGDDNNGSLNTGGTVIDDEDGVAPPIDPFVRSKTNTLQITATNTTGTPSYLQAWMDFNGDGDFGDAGEQIASNFLLSTGTIPFPVTVPANATIGATYARFRYSQTLNLSWFGDADSGEVEDYAFSILGSPDVAVADDISISRNSLAIDVTDQILANDFQTPDNPLQIVRIQKNGAPLSSATRGTVTLSGGRVRYTPPTGYIGLDRFAYVVRDSFNRESTAVVTINVTFLSAVPIAVDDFFEVPPEGSVNRALNVLDNDVPSTAGGLSIISVQPGDRGGTITTVGGGQSIRYTPLAGFEGTEQFDYFVQDSSGQISSATVTVNILPGSRDDDVVDISIDILNKDQMLQSSFNVGDEVLVRVYVEDLEAPDPGDPFPALNPDGVASVFLDLLYSDALLAVLPKPVGSTLPFDFNIDFGALFQGFVGTAPANNNPDAQGSSQVPGLLNEIGAFQTSNPNIQHNGRVELFTVRMQAVSSGIAVVQGDPANNAVSETLTVGSTEVLTPSQIRFGSAEFEIFPGDKVLSAAVDDSFPDNMDSLDQSFGNTAISTYRLNVLENDFLGFELDAAGNEIPRNIIDREILTQGGFGQASFNDNGTVVDPANPATFGALNDDFIEYNPNVGASGFESFSYFIVTDDGVRSVAEVSMAINDSANDQVEIIFTLVDENGNALSLANGVSVGDTFGVQFSLRDIRAAGIGIPTSVFAGYLDVLYSSGLIVPADTTTASRNQVSQGFFNFDVTFEDDFRVNAAVGSAQTPGIINEFGAFLNQEDGNDDPFNNGNLMATIYFDAVARGTARVVGDPADSFPFQDTLLSRENQPVPVSEILYDVLEFNITGPSGEFIQNTNRPADVNNDGDLSPLDALLVMNRLALEASNAQGEDSANSQFFLDVSGEGELSPLDALMVLNALADARAESQSPQAELVSDTLQVADTSDQNDRVYDTVASDSLFSELNQHPVFGSASSSDFAAAASIQIGGDDSSENGNDDLLNLLADDLSDLGN